MGALSNELAATRARTSCDAARSLVARTLVALARCSIVRRCVAPKTQSIQIQVDDGRGVERQHLAEDQAADDRDAQRLPQLRRPRPCRSSAASRPASPPSSSSGSAAAAAGTPRGWPHTASGCARARTAARRRSSGSRSSSRRPTSRNSPSIAIRLNSVSSMRSASSAPTPADGSVERIVSGCM